MRLTRRLPVCVSLVLLVPLISLLGAASARASGAQTLRVLAESFVAAVARGDRPAHQTFVVVRLLLPSGSLPSAWQRPLIFSRAAQSPLWRLEGAPR